jgi:chromosome segregation protein
MDNGEARNVQVDRRRAIEKSKIRLEEMGGAGGQEVMKEYKDAEDRDQFLMKELGDLMQSSETLNTLIADLTEKLNEMFKDGIKKINTEFDRFFKLMFGGGEACLEIIKEVKKKRKKLDEDLETEMPEEEEVSEGIDIHVALPHKRTKGLMMLSGGERALTSIALLFAMSQVNPPPFIILDETDAALDEANSRKYGDMIEALSKHSQLILITHNRETMSRAGVIYGVTMAGEGHSKLLSIAFDEAVVVAK